MDKLNIPSGYNTVMPYLILKSAGGFIQFTKNVFGAEERLIHKRDEHTFMHGEIIIGESVIMFADSADENSVRTAGLFVYVPYADIAYNKALENGATIITPLSNQSYGRSGGIMDPFGNTWWITSPLAA